MTKEIPQAALGSAALTVATNEDSKLQNRHLNEAVAILEASICPEEGCMLLRGHNTDCLPTLLKFTEDRHKLISACKSLLAAYGKSDPFAEAIKDYIYDLND